MTSKFGAGTAGRRLPMRLMLTDCVVESSRRQRRGSDRHGPADDLARAIGVADQRPDRVGAGGEEHGTDDASIAATGSHIRRRAPSARPSNRFAQLEHRRHPVAARRRRRAALGSMARSTCAWNRSASSGRPSTIARETFDARIRRPRPCGPSRRTSRARNRSTGEAGRKARDELPSRRQVTDHELGEDARVAASPRCPPGADASHASACFGLAGTRPSPNASSHRRDDSPAAQ